MDTYFCRGAGEAVCSPRFSFHGFRCARIQGLRAALEAGDVAALVIHNDLQPTGIFCCGSPIVDRLQGRIAWGQRGNFPEAPTNCPQQNERLGRSGDAQVFVDTKDITTNGNFFCRE
jgi:alpha-L-rhamnosidase